MSFATWKRQRAGRRAGRLVVAIALVALIFGTAYELLYVRFPTNEQMRSTEELANVVLSFAVAGIFPGIVAFLIAWDPSGATWVRRLSAVLVSNFVAGVVFWFVLMAGMMPLFDATVVAACMSILGSAAFAVALEVWR